MRYRLLSTAADFFCKVRIFSSLELAYSMQTEAAPCDLGGLQSNDFGQRFLVTQSPRFRRRPPVVVLRGDS
jgi:hypothetical protein